MSSLKMANRGSKIDGVEEVVDDLIVVAWQFATVLVRRHDIL